MVVVTLSFTSLMLASETVYLSFLTGVINAFKQSSEKKL